MNVTPVTGRAAPAAGSRIHRIGVVAATAMAVAGAGLVAHAAVAGARFEMIVAALGLGAGAALVTLLAPSPGVSVVRDDP